MAQATEVSDLIDRLLRSVDGLIEDLIEFSDTWEHLSAWERDSWSLDWDQFVLLHLARLDRDYHARRMTPDQEQNYQRLLGRLREQKPTMERLRLTVPAMLVDA